jgi:hypothetical protein
MGKGLDDRKELLAKMPYRLATAGGIQIGAANMWMILATGKAPMYFGKHTTKLDMRAEVAALRYLGFDDAVAIFCAGLK